MRKDSDTEKFNCIICKEDRHYFSIGVCEHRRVCNYCSLRSRILYNDKKCPICTTKLETVYIFERSDKTSYLEMEENKDFFYDDDEFDKNGIYYSTVSAKEEAIRLKNYICPVRSCTESAFENLQTLCSHMNKVHKRYFCETCLKEGKKFLSEMRIYTYEALNEHVTYGEYSDKGSLIIPPHPQCTFCNFKYYNDESLFKHMNELHFICTLCRDKKSIVFYKEISHLMTHYQNLHFVCPYQECLEDVFVVFESQEKLNSHLVTKHKCVDAQNKLASFRYFEKKKSDTSNSYNGKGFKNFAKDEFNFSEYIESLKERVKEHISSFSENHQNTNFKSKNSNGRNNSNWNNENIPEMDHHNDQRRGGHRQRGRKNFHIEEETQIRLDYSFIFNAMVKIIKEYIIKRIKTKNPPEEDFILPRETIYQIIIIVDRLNEEKMLELTSLNNFGIDLDIYKELKGLLSSATLDEYFSKCAYNVLDKLETKKLLIVNKYIVTSQKKIDGMFYKLELEQIEPDLYDDFAFREMKYKKAKEISYQSKKQYPKERKIGMENKNLQTLTRNPTKSSIQDKGDSKLNNLFKNPISTTTPNSNNATTKKIENLIETSTELNSKPQNKLTLFFDNKIEMPNKDLNSWKQKKFIKKKVDYDDEFPEL